MHVDRPLAFWLFLILLPILIIFGLAIRSFYKFGKTKGITTFLAYSKIPSWQRRWLAYSLYVLAISSCFLALTESYVYIAVRDKQYQNIRLIFVVDVSRSMAYAEDVSPNRLVATKKEIKEFYLSLDGIYECSILPFAGDVNPYFCPFTSTKISFLDALNELDWRSAPTLGTDLTKAIEAIDGIYIKKDKIDQSGLNVIILFSDGGKEEALAINRAKLLRLTQELATKNFKIYTVGVGSDKPAPLIVRNENDKFLHYITDAHNQIATSLMDEEILKQISEQGHGNYYRLNSSVVLAYDLQQVINENRQLVSEKARQEKFHLQHYLFSATVCLLMICILLNKV